MNATLDVKRTSHLHNKSDSREKPALRASVHPALPIGNACACGGGCPQCESRLPIQTELAVSQPRDPYEQEAGRIAEAVVASPAPHALRRKCACEGGPPCPECTEDKKELVLVLTQA